MIHFLLVVGKNSKGHQSGRTLLSMGKQSGSPCWHPILRNITYEEVETFIKQVQIIDMIDCEDKERIVEKLKELSLRLGFFCSCEKSAK